MNYKSEIRALRQQVRQLRLAISVLLAGCLGLLLLGLSGDDVIQARSVSIVDEQGNTAIELGTVGSGGRIRLYNNLNDSYFSMNNNGRPGLLMTDSTGSHSLASFGVGVGDVPRLGLSYGARRPAFSVTAMDFGPAMWMWGPQGEEILAVP